MSAELDALVAASEAHRQAFDACRDAHSRRNRAIIDARLAGHSWEQIAAADGARAVTSIRTLAYVLWRSGEYGEIPDEALTVHDRRRRERERRRNGNA